MALGQTCRNLNSSKHTDQFCPWRPYTMREPRDRRSGNQHSLDRGGKSVAHQSVGRYWSSIQATFQDKYLNKCSCRNDMTSNIARAGRRLRSRHVATATRLMAWFSARRCYEGFVHEEPHSSVTHQVTIATLLSHIARVKMLHWFNLSFLVMTWSQCVFCIIKRIRLAWEKMNTFERKENVNDSNNDGSEKSIQISPLSPILL